MKKLQITISDDAHLKLLEVQFDRKKTKHPRTTLIEVASDVLEEKLNELEQKKATQN